MQTISIDTPGSEIVLKLKIIDNPVSQKLSQSLPIESAAKTWGGEIYFETGLTAPAYNLTTDVNVGDVAYWPDGKCLCVFFGRTPASTGDKPIPASGVVVVGKASVDPEDLGRVKPGARIKVS